VGKCWAANWKLTMNKTIAKKYFWIALRVVLGVIFVYASYYKIKSPGAFAHGVYNFKILPPWAINPVAIVLPWLQLLWDLLMGEDFSLGHGVAVVLGKEGAVLCEWPL